MKRIFILIGVIFIFTSIHSQATVKRVAILISSYGSLEHPDLSYDLEELAQAYLVLTDNGLEVDIISPRGGAVLIKTNKDDLPYIQKFKKIALTKLKNTLATQYINRNDYDAVFIVGGGGAMFDLPTHNATQSLLTQFANDKAPIAAVCHGPAAIVNLKLTNGEYFVKNRLVNSFTNTEEAAFNSENMDKFSFLNEDRLKANGATFIHNAPMLPFVAVDGDLITAQNPSSVPKAAEALVVKLGFVPKLRIPFKDEATMALIAEARTNGTYLIDIALVKSPDIYDLNLLALYGFYSYQLAKNDADKMIELRLMETIANHFQHPSYQSRLITAYIEQGLSNKAKVTFQNFIKQYPEHELTEELKLEILAM
jgi:putative intracellular protease/amidase